MPVINYAAHLHLPRVITGPGRYRTTHGRTVIVLGKRMHGLNPDHEWWSGEYEGGDGGTWNWMYTGVRRMVTDERLLPVRPGLQYIRSYR